MTVPETPIERIRAVVRKAGGRIAAVRPRAWLLDRRIEQLQDLEWRRTDAETRYRELLDSQTDIIWRTDPAGHLTFANRAFCRTFGVDAGRVLGQAFAPTILRGDGPAERELATIAGPRWFAIETLSIADQDGRLLELQSIGRDVTEERRAVAALARSRDEALAANSAKSRFLAAMSHEIRTPMNGILGMTGLLGDTQLSPEQSTYAQAIDKSARTLLTIIDEILDLSKIEAGKLELHPVSFPLDNCVQSVVELLAPKAAEKQLELVWRVAPDVPATVTGDETRIRQILLNLIGNAIKFTDRGGVAVRIGCDRPGIHAGSDGSQPAAHPLQLTIEVRDTGIGLGADQLATLFAEFGQAGIVAQRRRGGTGLGLAISRRLARAMGGDIWVTSEPGRGSVFTAGLNVTAGTASRPFLVRAAANSQRHVLLALDRPIERQELADSVTALRIQAATIFTGQAGTPIGMPSDGRDYDAVIVDGSAGIEAAGRVLSCVRAAARRTVRGIVLIDSPERGQLPQFRAAGFDAYLIRPVRPLSLAGQLGIAAGTASKRAGAAVAAPAARLAAGESTARRILLVEDNDINALLARRVSERAGCIVYHARDGQEALDWCARELGGGGASIDLVLMDIHMPVLDGFETTTRMKDLLIGNGWRVPPIVALTANAFAEDRKRCLDAGLDDFLAKPFDRAELEALLDKWGGAPGGPRDGVLDDLVA